MEKSEILEKIKEVFAEIFKNNQLIIDELTSSKQIHEWDSLKNIVLLSTIEKKFNVKFSIDDIFNTRNVGDICNLVYAKINA